MKTAVIRARVPEQLKQDFEALASAQGWNLSQAVRQLMKQYVEQGKEISLRNEETLEALADIEAGRVVEGNSVLDWLGSWGTEDEREPPV